jgi:uncharacterized protein
VRGDDSPGSLTFLPVGTQVVMLVEDKGEQVSRPRGTVGVITGAPTEGVPTYRVRFSDGGETALPREHLISLKLFQQSGRQSNATGAPAHTAELSQYVIYRCVVGSRAYGLEEAASDTDRRGIYLPPAALHWSLGGVLEQLENQETQECYWELQKFLTLALRANPNIWGCLYTPLVEMATPLTRELLAMRSCFLSRLVYQTYNGYVMSQFRKLGQDVRNLGTIRWKHAMHLIRLLMSGIAILKDGSVPVRVAEHRQLLLSIRHGDMPWAEIDQLRLSLHKEFDTALTHTSLPERPDYDRANAFLLKARRSMV